MNTESTNASPLTRRGFLAQMLVGVGVFNLPNVFRLRAEAASSERRSDTSLIFLWQDGGPSHFETFDPKPDAPKEVRGPIGSIPTRLPGIRFGETLPRLARLADKFTIIRSLHQASSSHVSASHTFVTGYDRTGVITGPPAHPDIGAVVHRVRGDGLDSLPAYVGTGVDDRIGLHRGGVAYAGPSWGPFRVKMTPDAGELEMRDVERINALSTQRLRDRFDVLGELDRLRAQLDATGEIGATDRFQQRALGLLSSGAVARAFDLTRESPRLRERYGMFAAGQQALLARRLVESGVDVVAVRFVPLGNDSLVRKHNNWDDHAVNTDIFRTSRLRDPQMDQAASALVEDLASRGLDKKVLVVLAGEFGRTPRITYHKGRPGRDHWGPAGCALVYGGGMEMGQVIGATNVFGERPADRPLLPQDLLATMYRFLGIDTRHELLDLSGRPWPILHHGEPIRELFG